MMSSKNPRVTITEQTRFYDIACTRSVSIVHNCSIAKFFSDTLPCGVRTQITSKAWQICPQEDMFLQKFAPL